jgi:uncharacterized delta-60 repeat protein
MKYFSLFYRAFLSCVTRSAIFGPSIIFCCLSTAYAQPEFSRSELQLIKKHGSYSNSAKLKLPQEHFPNPPISASNASPSDGDIDPNFNAAVTEAFGYVYETVVQPDGRIIAIGLFQRANGARTNGIARLNADGSLDSSFATGSGANLAIRTVALQPDGKIIIGGAFTSFNGVVANRIVRLNSDGSVDGTFNLGVAFNNQINAVLVLSSGKILVGGQFSISSSRLVRLNSDGTLDLVITGFNNTVFSFALAPDGKIVVGGLFSAPKATVARLNSDGSLDASFSPTSGGSGYPAFKVVVQPNGKIVAAGAFSIFNGSATDGIVRLNENGTVDATFELTNDFQVLEVHGLALQPDGKILVGFFDNGVSDFGFADVRRFNSDASPDLTFNTNAGGLLPTVSLNLLADGNVLAAGYFTFVNGHQHIRLVKLGSNGAVDDNFSPSLSSFGIVYAMKRQPDGKILIGGDFEYVNGERKIGIARLNSDGTLDDGFTIGGELTGDIYAIEVQPDGKILLGGNFVEHGPNLMASGAVRINSNGSFDASLNGDLAVAIAYAFVLQGDGRILIGGQVRNQSFNLVAAVRRSADGSSDATFTAPLLSNGVVRSMLVQQSGKIVVGGTFLAQGIQFERTGLARLNSDGTLESATFAGNANVYSLKQQQSDSSIYAGGSNLTKHNSEGLLDPTFDTGTGLNQVIRAVEIQPNGKIVIGGNFTTYNGAPADHIARIKTDGSLDLTFTGGSEAPGSIFSLQLQSDGKLLVGGQFLDFNNVEKLSIVRLQTLENHPPTLFDYDGDGRADRTVQRPSNDLWYLLRTTAGYTAMTWGVAGDLLAPADYDGDGKTDIAVFRPSTGTWHIVNSGNGAFLTYNWGADGDLPVPADHNADGKADLVLFRQSDGMFYRRMSDNSFSNVSFGVTGDKPVIGDFDKDGQFDIGVYRPSNNNWYLRKSTAGFFVQTWGEAGDIPVPADYDGDGQTDLAVWRSSNGRWYRAQSTAGFDGVNWGEPGDKPVPADYDGDGKADVAIFRPATGTWYMIGTTIGQLVQQFGQDGDVPTPSAFIY